MLYYHRGKIRTYNIHFTLGTTFYNDLNMQRTTLKQQIYRSLVNRFSLYNSGIETSGSCVALSRTHQMLFWLNIKFAFPNFYIMYIICRMDVWYIVYECHGTHRSIIELKRIIIESSSSSVSVFCKCM